MFSFWLWVALWDPLPVKAGFVVAGKTTQQSAEIDHLDQFDALLNDFEKIGKVPDPDNEPPAVEPDVPGALQEKFVFVFAKVI